MGIVGKFNYLKKIYLKKVISTTFNIYQLSKRMWHINTSEQMSDKLQRIYFSVRH